MSKRSCVPLRTQENLSSNRSNSIPIEKNSRQKSRSHLVLFEEVTPPMVGDRISRQTDHHNAIGYLVKPHFSETPPTPTPNMVSSSRPLAPQSSPMEIKEMSKSQLDIYEQYHSYQRAMSPDKPMLTLADRNQSSAVAQAIGGFGYDTFSTSKCSTLQTQTQTTTGRATNLSRRPQSSLGVVPVSSSFFSQTSDFSPTFTTSTSTVLPSSDYHHRSKVVQKQSYEDNFEDGFHEGNQFRALSQSFCETAINGRTTPIEQFGLPAHFNTNYPPDRPISSSRKHLEQQQHSSYSSQNPQYYHHHSHHSNYQQKHQTTPQTAVDVYSPKADSEESFFSLVDQPELNQQTRSHSTPYSPNIHPNLLYSSTAMANQNVSFLIFLSLFTFLSSFRHNS